MLQPENFYFTELTSSIPSATSDGTFTASSVPSGTRGWLVIDYDDSVKREIIKYHNVSGSSIYYRGIDRTSPKEHSIGAKVMMADVAEYFKYFEGLIGDTFYIEKVSALSVKCWGGKVRIGGIHYDVSDQSSLSLSDNSTNYIYLDLSDQTIKVSITLTTAEAGVLLHTIVTSGGSISSITKHTPKDVFSMINMDEETSNAADDDELIMWDKSAGKMKRIQKVRITPPGVVTTPWTTTGLDLYYTTGKVGIGTSTPSVELDVVGQGKFTGTVEVDTPTAGGHAATKTYVDGKVDDTAYSSSWNGVTVIAPSKNSVYDALISQIAADNKYQVKAGSDIDGTSTPKAIVSYVNSAVAIDQSQSTSVNSAEGLSSSVPKIGQTFVTSASINHITQISVTCKRYASTTGALNLSLFLADANDEPTGSVLGSIDIDYSGWSTTTYGTRPFVFDNDILVSPNTKYIFVFSGITSSSFNPISFKSSYDDSAYASGRGRQYTTLWEYTNRDLHFFVYGYNGFDGVTISDASDSSKLDFVGFCSENASIGSLANIQYRGVVGGFSGLSAGSTMYLSDTIGEISNTPGSNTVRIGAAISDTEIIISP